MLMQNTLLLGSKSPSRKILLEHAKIPFKTVDQDADEAACDWGLPLTQLVEQIALHKMEHVVLSAGKDGDVCFVLTADTMSQDKNGNIQGKPVDRTDAIAKIISAREGSRLCSSFCLDKKVFKNGTWEVEKRIHKSVHAEYTFYIPDDAIEDYFANSIGLQCAGAIAVEEYGMQFLKEVHGSYSTIVGLPMFELREALFEIGFFNQ